MVQSELRKCLEINFHKQRKVSVPERITLLQLMRWLVFGFVPLPQELEIELSHLPILDRGIFENKIVRGYFKEFGVAKDRLLSSLHTGLISAYGIKATGNLLTESNDEVRTQIPKEFWQEKKLRIHYYNNSAEINLLSFHLDLEEMSQEEAQAAMAALLDRIGSLKYTDIDFRVAQVASIFGFDSDIESHSFQEVEPIETRKSAYWITYSLQQEIVLNDNFNLAQPNKDSVNDIFFNFINRNPNRKITRVEIEEHIPTLKQRTKRLHDFVSQLGFSGKLRELFFDVSSDSITFHNPITYERAEKLGATTIRIQELLKSDKGKKPKSS